MKILFLSGCAPARYNHREPNAYPYYIIKEVASRFPTGVVYFNENIRLKAPDIEAGLKYAGVSWQRKLQPGKLFKALFTLLYIPRAILLKLFTKAGRRLPLFLVPLQLSIYKKVPDRHFEDAIREFSPDLVIVFPMQLYFAIKTIRKLSIPVCVLCTDSPTLHFRRQKEVSDRIPASRLVTLQMEQQSRKLERLYSKIDATYLFVGHQDRASFVINSGKIKSSHFIPHHLYANPPVRENWKDTDGRINIIFSGDGHTIYVGDEVDRIAEKIVESKMLETGMVNFHFLGSGYDRSMNLLGAAGYTVIHKQWVDDYEEYISGIQVQVFPIILGTGTKAKVLAAMTSGLLCIGTSFAFENIDADMSDYVLYQTASDIPAILAQVVANRQHYEQIALTTKNKILENHNTARVVSILLSTVKTLPD